MFNDYLFLLGVGQFVYVHSNNLRKWSGKITLLLHKLLTPIDIQGKMVNNIKKKIKLLNLGQAGLSQLLFFVFKQWVLFV